MNIKKKRIIEIVFYAILVEIGYLIFSRIPLNISDYYKDKFGLTSDVRKSISIMTNLYFVAGAFTMGVVALIGYKIEKYAMKNDL